MQKTQKYHQIIDAVGHSRTLRDDGASALHCPGDLLFAGSMFRSGGDFGGGLLRAALDEVKFGIVLLDAELRAQFINRAFRKMWRLPDSKADGGPTFVSLMDHGRDSLAYDLPEPQLDAHVAERVAHVKSGDPTPRIIRLKNGDVLRFQCTVLPDGGRMLSYTYVTDIVQFSDELEILHIALDKVDEGVIVLDPEFNARFMNRAVRRLWGVSDEQADRKPPYAELVNDSRHTHTYGVAPEELDEFIAHRLALVKSGNPRPHDLKTHDGRTIRSKCTVLPDGGRMLTYTDVTDLVCHAEELERLATTDSMTGVYNRRHFHVLADGEWRRFQRHHRPLSLLAFDVDHFKSINDRFGHDVGDCALAHVCDLFRGAKRGSDILARVGGDEFCVLLPETELEQAQIAAERFRISIQKNPLKIDSSPLEMTISVGVAEACPSYPGVQALMKMSDRALYLAKSRGRNQVAAAREIQAE